MLVSIRLNPSVYIQGGIAGRSGDSTRRNLLSLIQSRIVFQMQPDVTTVRPIAESASGLTLSLSLSLGTSIASKARPIWPKQASQFPMRPRFPSPQNNVKPDLSRGHCQSFKLKSNQCFSNHDALRFPTLSSFNSHSFPSSFTISFIRN